MEPGDPGGAHVSDEPKEPEATNKPTTPTGPCQGQEAASGRPGRSAARTDPARETVPQSFWKGYDVNPAAKTTPQRVSKVGDE
jgi:hypothetical protein